MSARIVTACAAALRMRRHLDVDALTAWLVLMAGLFVATGAALALSIAAIVATVTNIGLSVAGIEIGDPTLGLVVHYGIGVAEVGLTAAALLAYRASLARPSETSTGRR